jgi:hypothetical protein
VLAVNLANAGLETGRPLRDVARAGASPSHFTGHDTVGLRAAANKVSVMVPCEAMKAPLVRVLAALAESSSCEAPSCAAPALWAVPLVENPGPRGVSAGFDLTLGGFQHFFVCKLNL